MQLRLLLGGVKKSRRRVGRGGKRGTTSGRGQKGQKSRAGRRIRPASRDLLLRLPKRRGFKNLPQNPPAVVFNLKDLSRFSGFVNRQVLIKAGFLTKRYHGPVKILGGGEAPAGLTIKGFKVSAAARKKIVGQGGHIQ